MYIDGKRIFFAVVSDNQNDKSFGSFVKKEAMQMAKCWIDKGETGVKLLLIAYHANIPLYVHSEIEVK